MASKPLVTINLVVHNGERYIRHCLAAVKSQTYSNLEINVFDNNSTDLTREITAREFPSYNLIAHSQNLGMWPGQETALQYSRGEYIVALSVDVMLDKNFVQEAVWAFSRHPHTGAIQAKVYQYDITKLGTGNRKLENKIIDTCGFKIFRSRQMGNIGHGESDQGQFEVEKDIFGVEGAVPVFQREAFEDCRIENYIADPDYFWYGDDFDIAWRMRLFGWDQWYIPSLIAYHDRSTTKGQARSLGEHLSRLGKRRQIPIKKRRLDWSNVRFTIIKNDYIINVLKDLPHIVIREIAVFLYTLLFEPAVFLELGRFMRLLPRMISR